MSEQKERIYLCRVNKEERTVIYARFTFDTHHSMFRMREHGFWQGDWRRIQAFRRSSEQECRELMEEKINILKNLGYIEIDPELAPKGKQK